MENKEATIQPIDEEELENASGGVRSGDMLRKIRYRCTACGCVEYGSGRPSPCPMCGGMMTIDCMRNG